MLDAEGAGAGGEPSAEAGHERDVADGELSFHERLVQGDKGMPIFFAA